MATFGRLLRAGGFTVSGAAIWKSELHVTRVFRKFAQSAFGGSGVPLAEATEKRMTHLQKHQRPNDAKSLQSLFVCFVHAADCLRLQMCHHDDVLICIDVCAWIISVSQLFGHGPRIRGQLRWLREHLEFQLHPWQVRRATRSGHQG